MENQTQRRERALLRNTLFVFFVSGACTQPLGSLIPFLRESYGLSYDVSGMLLSFQSAGNLVAVLCAGLLAVALGRRRGILTTAVWMAVAFLLFTAGVGAPAVLMLACFMTGFARGGNSNFSSTMISTLPGDKATRGYNLIHGAFAVGALLSPLALIGLTRLWPTCGWRVLTGLLGALALIQLAVYATMDIPAAAQAKAGARKKLDLAFLKIPQFWLGATMMFFYISAEYAIVGWLVSYFKDAGILPADLAQLMNSLLWLVILIGRLIGAAITGKVSKRLLLVIDGVGFFACFLLLFFSRSGPAVALSLMGTGLFMSTIYPTAYAFGSDCVRNNEVGTGVLLFLGSIGGILTPALVGFVAERAGIRAGMTVVVACAGLLLCSILLSSARRWRAS